jgi:hypothetical protein
MYSGLDACFPLGYKPEDMWSKWNLPCSQAVMSPLQPTAAPSTQGKEAFIVNLATNTSRVLDLVYLDPTSAGDNHVGEFLATQTSP